LIDFDIVPFDALQNAGVQNGRLLINGESYGALIVSESEIMPYNRLNCFARLAKSGLSVIFEGTLPKISAEGLDISNLLPCFEAINEGLLVNTLRKRGLCQISASGTGLNSLRFYHVTRDGKDIYLFSNEDIYGTLDAKIMLKQAAECLIYEPWENKCYKSSAENGELYLHLEGGNMLFVIFGDEIPDNTPYLTYESQRTPLPIRFEIAVMDEGQSEFKVIATDSECFDISAPDRIPSFSGTVRYRARFNSLEGFSVIDLGQVGETAQVWLNGVYLGARINVPYKFSMQGALKDQENELEIIVKSNLAHRRHDWLSSYMQIPPTGILGNISLCKYEK